MADKTTLRMSYRFLSIAEGDGDGDIILQCAVRIVYADEVPENPEAPEVRVRRFQKNTSEGMLRVTEPGEDGSPSEGAQTTSDSGEVIRSLTGQPLRLLGADQWTFFVHARPGGKQVSFHLDARLAGGSFDTGKGPLLATRAMGTEAQFFNAPQGSTAPAKRILVSGQLPRLVTGLNDAAVAPSRKGSQAVTGFEKDIAPLLAHVLERLRSPMDDAWGASRSPGLSQQRGPDADHPTVTQAPVHRRTEPLRLATDAWVNQVAEMFDLLPYGGPGALCAISETRIVGPGLEPGTPHPFYPITAACQQLCSLTLASRGLSLKTLINAGISTTKTWVKELGGKWITASSPDAPEVVPDDQVGTVISPHAALRTSKLLFKIREVEPTVSFGPGSIFLYSNRATRNTGACFVYEGTEYCLSDDARTQTLWGVRADGSFLSDNTAGAHVGIVLRADPVAGTFQLLDTGGCQVPSWSDGVIAAGATSGGFHSGIFDGPTATTVGAGADPFRGVGVLPHPAVDDLAGQQRLAEQLSKQVQDVLKKAMPVGFVRFVLQRRGVQVTPKNVWRFAEEDWLLYASPLLPMWESAPTANYSISRYLWSLRDLPGREHVQAFWFFYVPQRELAEVMLEAGARERSIEELAGAALRRMKPITREKYERREEHERIGRILADRTYPVADGTVRADGKVEIAATYRKVRRMHPLHSLEGRWGSTSRLPLNKCFLQQNQSDSGFETYFRG